MLLMLTSLYVFTYYTGVVVFFLLARQRKLKLWSAAGAALTWPWTFIFVGVLSLFGVDVD